MAELVQLGICLQSNYSLNTWHINPVGHPKQRSTLKNLKIILLLTWVL